MSPAGFVCSEPSCTELTLSDFAFECGSLLAGVQDVALGLLADAFDGVCLAVKVPLAADDGAEDTAPRLGFRKSDSSSESLCVFSALCFALRETFAGDDAAFFSETFAGDDAAVLPFFALCVGFKEASPSAPSSFTSFFGGVRLAVEPLPFGSSFFFDNF